MFINFSNHPAKKWVGEQIAAAESYGDIVDVVFPQVSPDADSGSVKKLAEEYAEKIIAMNPDCVMCVGEFTLCYHVISALKARGIKVVAACTERNVNILTDKNGTEHKDVVFRFAGFREY